MELAEKKWFSSWFDTPYYHILYRNRNDDEARKFMRNLVDFLNLPAGSSILDLACGKGRHSIFLNQLGYDVTGVDLSANSIAYAKQFEDESLHFRQHCMCTALDEQFDAVFSLFTSIGYFEDEQDNLETIKAIKQEIRPGGFGIIDFMNVKKVISNLVPHEDKEVKDIRFQIDRRVEQGFILKDIRFRDDGEDFFYTEKVKAITLEGFRNYFRKAGITLLHTFGNYELEAFDEQHSDRLILVFR